MSARTAFLDGRDAESARQAIDAIAADLARHDPAWQLSLGLGVADRAVFYAWYAEIFGDEASSERSRALLDYLVEGARSPADDHALFNGSAGVGWAIAHLCDRESADVVLERIDAAIVDALESQRWTGEYDLVSGLVGLGVYALARAPGKRAHRMLERILYHLEASAVPRFNGLAWHTPAERLPPWQRLRAPQGYFNYGLAHGVPGIVGLLAAMIEAGEHEARAGALLGPALSGLLAAELPAGAPSHFPSWDDEVSPPQGSRGAWCYGDPGVAIAIARAARALRSVPLREAANVLMRATAARGEAAAGIVDAGLCHGAFGLAHLLRRFAAFAPDQAIRGAAVDWVRRGLLMRREGEGLGGFRSYRPKSGAPADEHWVDDASLLTGSSGIGLVLMSMLHGECDDWDAPLLTNL